MSYYVYTLTDPRSGLVFYVGKGKGSRIDAHEAAARKGVYSRKCETIREIWAEGHQVAKAVVSRHKEEADAYAAEAALIESIGLANLTNVIPGGIWAPREKKPNIWTIKSVRALASKLRRALVYMQSNEGRLLILDKYDMGPAIADMVRAMCKDLGTEKVEKALKVTFV